MSGLEALGIVASVIQIADIGARLSVKLCTFAHKIKNADANIRFVSTDVALTCNVLRELGENLKKDERGKLCGEGAVRTAEGVVRECQKVFEELEGCIDGTRAGNEEKGKKGLINRIGRGVKFTVAEPQIELLRSNLERLKSTLLLMLNVIIYAGQLRSKAKTEVLQEQQQLIKTLNEEKKENDRRFEQLTKAIEGLEISRETNELKKVPTNDSTYSSLHGSSRPSTSELRRQENMDSSVLVNMVQVQEVEDPTQPTMKKRRIREQPNPPAHSLPHPLASSEELSHYCTLVKNLLNEVEDVQYKLEHQTRGNVREGILNSHLGTTENLVSKHGHDRIWRIFSTGLAEKANLSESLVSEKSVPLMHAAQMVKLRLLPETVLSALRGSSSLHNDQTAHFSDLDPLLGEVWHRPPHIYRSRPISASMAEHGPQHGNYSRLPCIKFSEEPVANLSFDPANTVHQDQYISSPPMPIPTQFQQLSQVSQDQEQKTSQWGLQQQGAQEVIPQQIWPQRSMSSYSPYTLHTDRSEPYNVNPSLKAVSDVTSDPGRSIVGTKGKRVHSCEVPGCNKVFTRTEHRRRHELTHSSDASFSCPKSGCGKAFHRLDLLARHVELHDLDAQGDNASRHERTISDVTSDSGRSITQPPMVHSTGAIPGDHRGSDNRLTVTSMVTPSMTTQSYAIQTPSIWAGGFTLAHAPAGYPDLKPQWLGVFAESAESPSESLNTPGSMHVPVTVDVQAASKMSDEKRQRNAGASARFRQRRKGKEDEASQMIRKLEQEIQDTIKDRDFYRSERDSYLEILSRTQTLTPFQPSPEQSLESIGPLRKVAGPSVSGTPSQMSRRTTHSQVPSNPREKNIEKGQLHASIQPRKRKLQPHEEHISALGVDSSKDATRSSKGTDIDAARKGQIDRDAGKKTSASKEGVSESMETAVDEEAMGLDLVNELLLQWTVLDRPTLDELNREAGMKEITVL